MVVEVIGLMVVMIWLGGGGCELEKVMLVMVHKTWTNYIFSFYALYIKEKKITRVIKTNTFAQENMETSYGRFTCGRT